MAYDYGEGKDTAAFAFSKCFLMTRKAFSKALYTFTVPKNTGKSMVVPSIRWLEDLPEQRNYY